MERGQAQDQQSLMAVEVSGDSEAGPDLTSCHGLQGLMEEAAEDEDDMESCSCFDGYGNTCASYIDGDDDDDDDDDGQERNDDDDDDDDDDVGDGQERDDERVLEWASGMERTKPVKREEGEEKEEGKMVDRAEDDRRFWEACLASGYP